MELIFFIIFLGLLFDYTNGFHDAANVVSTVIATKVLRPVVAISFAAILNVAGAFLVGGVAETMTHGLIDPKSSSEWTILAAVVGAIVWNVITWYWGIPSSSSYALVGGLIGAALYDQGSGVIFWGSICKKVLLPMVISPLVGFFVAYLGIATLSYFVQKENKRCFRYLQIGSAGLIALSHGLNDAQKSMAVITLGLFTAKVIDTTTIPAWVIGSCALMMGLGTITGGYRIIKTMGYGITKLEPEQGFVAETSSSLVILLASSLGMPISSTQMIVGSITGVGAAKGMHKVRWSTGRRVVFAWFLTIPGSALVACLVSYFRALV